MARSEQVLHGGRCDHSGYGYFRQYIMFILSDICYPARRRIYRFVFGAMVSQAVIVNCIGLADFSHTAQSIMRIAMCRSMAGEHIGSRQCCLVRTIL